MSVSTALVPTAGLVLMPRSRRKEMIPVSFFVPRGVSMNAASLGHALLATNLLTVRLDALQITVSMLCVHSHLQEQPQCPPSSPRAKHADF